MITLERTSPNYGVPLARRCTRAGVRLWSAALFTLGAAFIHLAVAPGHLGEWLPFGIFFIGVGFGQIVLAADLLNRPTRRLIATIAAVNVGLIALWYVSRTSGLPIGPTPGQPEAVGLEDLACTASELLSIPLLLSLIAWPARRKLRRYVFIGLGSLPATLVSIALTMIAVAATLSQMPEAVNAAPARPNQSTTPVTALTEPGGDLPVEYFTLTAAPAVIDGQSVWALNGNVPGPELRVNQGDRVRVTLVNHLPESTTLHWHGVILPNAEDGVAGVTQDAIAPGAEYTYEFVAREAGTYWYHSHQQTGEQLPKGLFGALVVVPSGSTAQGQRDYAVMLHGETGAVSINGQPNSLHLDAKSGETVRLRLINAVAPGMDGGPEAPLLVGAPFKVVALDGRDLNQPDVLQNSRVPLGMGQRADIVFTMPTSGSVQLLDTELEGGANPISKFFQPSEARLASVIIGDEDAPSAVDAASAPLFDILHYGVPTDDPVANATLDRTLPLVLGEHPGIRDGVPQLIHTINSQASPDVTPITVDEGEFVRLHIVNTTSEYHPMHLHGHVFSILAVDGQPLTGSAIHQDSVLVGPNQTVDVAFAANNPGVWMFHCHVLLHASMGMTTTVNYVGYSTPFEMGTRSGNMPE
jgi:FtsP/CotA-like multicopper oxidase with cupredoxin domain